MSELPPLPPGFQIQTQAPPLPPGFVLQTEQPQGGGFMGGVADFFKSIPRGMASGAVNAPNASMVPMQDYEMQMGPIRQQSLEALKRDLPAPQGRAGRVGEAVGEALGNPITYMGPGSAALRLGGAALSGAGGEMAGQAAEGTTYEGPARIAGAVAGGFAGARALGPRAPKAAVPTQQELRAAADQGYGAARESGLEIDPAQFAQWAAQQGQNLGQGPKYAFTGGQYGTAPKTFGVLDNLQKPPAEAVAVGAGNIQTLRRQLGDIAGETKEFRPTTDAKAAMVLKRELDAYLENLPPGAVVAGDADRFVRSTKDANANYAAASRVGTFEKKLSNAKTNYEGSIAGNLSSSLKSELKPFLKNEKAQRGYTTEEIDAVKRANKGSLGANVLGQLGRGGAGVVPITAQLAAGIPTAVATGGANVIPQAALAAVLYGARKGGEAMTKARVEKLAETLAKRSPLYEERVSNLPAYDPNPARAALIRALMQGAQQ